MNDSRKRAWRNVFAVAVVLVAVVAVLWGISSSGVLSSSSLASSDDGNVATVSESVLEGESSESEDAADADDDADDEDVIVEDSDGNAMVDGELILTFELDVDEATVQSQMEAAGYAISKVLDSPNDYTGSTVMVDIPEGTSVEEAAEELLSIEGVGTAEPNYILYTMEDITEQDYEAAIEAIEAASTTIDDTYSSRLWALSAMNVYDAWDVAKVEGSVSVAVLDTGVETTHEDLADNIVATYSATGDDYECETKHGTHVAGIIAAVADNSLGVAGASYNAGIVAVDVSDSSGSISVEYVVAAYVYVREYADEYGIRVVNISLGSDGVTPESLATQIDLAADEGILTVCAAGNASSSSSGTVPYDCWPGDYETCISVINVQGTASSDGTYTFTRVSSSNYGGARDISAPGYQIYSTITGGSYGYLSGTSMASPQVAAVAALVFAAQPDLTVEECTNILYQTATDAGDEGFDEQFGWGVVDAYAAVTVASAFCEDSAHEYSVEATTEATCTRDGYGLYTCEICGYSYYGTIAATGHYYVEAEGEEATCTSTGYVFYECAYCGYAYMVVLPKTDHSYVETVLEEPTCSEEGSAVYTCEYCGYSYTATLDATGHSYVIADDGTYVAPTCTEEGYAVYVCSSCGDTYEEVLEALGHTYVLVDGSEPTCTEGGTGTYTCSVCGDTTVIYAEATGHTAGEWTTTVAATLGYAGEEEQYCEVCGELLDSREVDALVSVWERLGGTNRYQTMAAIVETAFEVEDGGTSEYAVVASGENFPDALAASYAAGVLEAPILLTTTDELSSDAAEQIEAVGASTVYVIGGESAVSSDAVDSILAIDGVTSVVRVGGSNRYETASKVCTTFRAIATGSGQRTTTAIIAYGGSFADALCASPLAYACGYPILLTKTSSLDQSTLSILASKAFDNVIVVGGTGVVSDSIVRQLERMGITVERLSGSNRYETSVAIAEYAVDEGLLSTSTVVVSTGANYPDALVGGVLAGIRDGLVLLAHPEDEDLTGRNSSMAAFLTENRENIDYFYILGGTGAVPAELEEALKGL